MRNELKALRVRKGLNQGELGKLIGVSYGTVSKWENGETDPRLNKISKLAKALGVSEDRIFFALSNHKITSKND
ncbi:MAG: helix-turn-helix transcriptional regulator [Limosilactobacillus vaginalis]|uniref:helix-turn-helix transcriptional regulator n=1 Tax=Limosilactobacillus vaginalis TaxID=1633 RepID=UPI003994EDCC